MGRSTLHSETCVDSNSKILVLILRLTPIRESLCLSVANLVIFRSLTISTDFLISKVREIIISLIKGWIDSRITHRYYRDLWVSKACRL